jgi:hypothetical protein
MPRRAEAGLEPGASTTLPFGVTDDPYARKNVCCVRQDTLA